MAAKTAGTWSVTDPAGIESLTTFGTTKLHALGRRCKAKDIGTTDYGYAEFIYLEGIGSTVRGSVVSVNDDFLTALGAARAKGAIAVALSACVASNYGWYQILGKGVATCGTVADGAQAYLVGSTGTIDDAVAVGDAIHGMFTSSADDTGTCLVTMVSYPVTTDADNT